MFGILLGIAIIAFCIMVLCAGLYVFWVVLMEDTEDKKDE